MKLLQPTQEQQNTILENFRKYLSTARTTGSELTYKIPVNKVLDKDVRPPTVLYTTDAWLKMAMLVQNNKEELAWHGVMEKMDDTYLIKDILVYPQVVTAASVDTDQTEYEHWLAQLPNEQFNNLRMQGHSHVSMSVSPSSTDTGLYEQMLQTLNDIPFYFFMITNRREEMHMLLYDFEQNVIFETKDIVYDVVTSDGATLLSNYLLASEENIKSKSTTQTWTSQKKSESPVTPAKEFDIKTLDALDNYYYRGANNGYY